MLDTLIGKSDVTGITTTVANSVKLMTREYDETNQLVKTMPTLTQSLYINGHEQVAVLAVSTILVTWHTAVVGDKRRKVGVGVGVLLYRDV